MPVILEILSDIDSPTRSQIKKALDYRREIKNQTTKAGIYLPGTKFCGGCSKSFSIQNGQEYFGEIFCKECVTKWISGEK